MRRFFPLLAGGVVAVCLTATSASAQVLIGPGGVTPTSECDNPDTQAVEGCYPCDSPDTEIDVEQCTECDDPFTAAVEVCCSDPADETSCGACDNPFTKEPETQCDSGTSEAEGCGITYVCGPPPDWRWKFFFDVANCVLADIGTTAPIPPPSGRGNLIPVQIVATAATTCNTGTTAVSYTFIVTPLNGSGPDVVFGGVVGTGDSSNLAQYRVSEATFVTPDNRGLRYSYRDANNVLQTRQIIQVTRKKVTGAGGRTVSIELVGKSAKVAN
jgi:hypothetical protein